LTSAAARDMFAIISDIHGNLEALEAVLADIDAQGAERIVCLGDVVGYGPNPAECVTRVRQRCQFVLKGNHDVAVVLEPLGFNQVARSAAIWSKKKLKPGWFSSRQTRQNWEFLSQLPEREQEGNFLFVHGSPRDPVMEYIEESDILDVGFGPSEKIQAIMGGIAGVCFVGHTHRPGVISVDYRFLKPAEIEGVWPLREERAIVNVGSVGQPRDGDKRACYVLVDAEAVRYRRVEYDVERTGAKIRAIGALHDILADRLLEGR